ncbi:hypothetical protein DICA3_F10132 [Diutina catenulata]
MGMDKTALPGYDSGTTDEELISNILPSYHMYQSTISKHLRPSNENFSDVPPSYDDSPSSSGTATSATPFALSAVVSPMEPGSVPEDDSFFPTDDTTQGYENTILANVHKLPNLTKRDIWVSNSLDINITVTKNVCQIGHKPTVIDPSSIEYTQGDFIHGYVTIVNRSEKPIPFDMVYVCFEGTTTVLENKRGLIDTEKTNTVQKFLSTIDLFASWTFANIDRLATDSGDPHDFCPGETDPYDGTSLSIDATRLLHPGRVYKRMFSFRVPEKLLDDACANSFPLHTELPPTLGVPRHSIPPSVLLANKDFQIRDFGFVDTSVSYSVDCRIVGKASDYGCAGSGQDQFVVAKDRSVPIRMIPRVNPELVFSRNMLEDEARLFYKALCDLIRDKIASGQALMSESRATPSLLARARTTKTRQMYDESTAKVKSCTKTDDGYHHVAAYKKKSLTGSAKILGVLVLATPRAGYTVEYVPPAKFGLVPRQTTVTVPLQLAYHDGKVVPEIRAVGCELHVLTVRSKKYPLPMEIVHDMCFNDEEVETKRRDADTFDDIVVRRFTEYSTQFATLIKALGNDTVQLESSLYRDIKSVATATTKLTILTIRDSGVQVGSQSANARGVHANLNTIPWEDGDNVKTKDFAVTVDLADCFVKGNDKQSEQITLVPSFQACLVARVYYLRVVLKLANGDSSFVSVPVYVEKQRK